MSESNSFQTPYILLDIESGGEASLGEAVAPHSLSLSETPPGFAARSVAIKANMSKIGGSLSSECEKRLPNINVQPKTTAVRRFSTVALNTTDNSSNGKIRIPSTPWSCMKTND